MVDINLEELKVSALLEQTKDIHTIKNICVALIT
jgi:hypothetical protein